MDDVSAMLLCTPILLPVVVSLGIHPIHFAAIIGTNLGLGNVTPPTAPTLYFGGRMAKTPVSQMMKPAMIFILFAWLPTLLAVDLPAGTCSLAASPCARRAGSRRRPI